MNDQNTKPADGEIRNGFFINNGTFSGWFTTPDGDAYDVRKLEPREVTDPRSDVAVPVNRLRGGI